MMAIPLSTIDMANESTPEGEGVQHSDGENILGEILNVKSGGWDGRNIYITSSEKEIWASTISSPGHVGDVENKPFKSESVTSQYKAHP